MFEDITVLNASHIPLLERLYAEGLRELSRRALPFVKEGESIETFLSAGYNYPVSVKHLVYIHTYRNVTGTSSGTNTTRHMRTMTIWHHTSV